MLDFWGMSSPSPIEKYCYALPAGMLRVLVVAFASVQSIPAAINGEIVDPISLAPGIDWIEWHVDAESIGWAQTGGSFEFQTLHTQRLSFTIGEEDAAKSSQFNDLDGTYVVVASQDNLGRWRLLGSMDYPATLKINSNIDPKSNGFNGYKIEVASESPLRAQFYSGGFTGISTLMFSIINGNLFVDNSNVPTATAAINAVGNLEITGTDEGRYSITTGNAIFT